MCISVQEENTVRDSHSLHIKYTLLSGKLSFQLLSLSNLFWVRSFIYVFFYWIRELMKGCSIACNSQQAFAVLRLYQILYTDLLGWNINTTSKCQMTLVKSCFRNIWSIYFSNTQCNEIFKVTWTVGHKVQPAWDFTNANFCCWELYQPRTFIYILFPFIYPVFWW